MAATSPRVILAEQFAFREFVYGVPARGNDVVAPYRKPYPQFKPSPARQAAIDARSRLETA